jgi:hypothetical protein
MSESTVDASLDDLMSGEYAVNAHLSADEMSTFITCGNVPMAEADDDDAVEDIVPEAGSSGGIGTETAVLMMTLLAGAAVATGLLVRRRAYQS